VAPGVVATSVFSFIFAWNEHIFALTFLSPDHRAKFILPVQRRMARGPAAGEALR